jgi:hypothetical protein
VELYLASYPLIPGDGPKSAFYHDGSPFNKTLTIKETYPFIFKAKILIIIIIVEVKAIAFTSLS